MAGGWMSSARSEGRSVACMAGALGLGYAASTLLVSGDGMASDPLPSAAVGPEPSREDQGEERIHEEDEVQPRKILVVDDSKLIHKMFEVLLRQFSLIHAHDGLEALQCLGTHSEIDLILLDINMPKMNGLEFLQQVKSDSAFADIPVVVVSTEGKEEDTERALAAGAADYIKKPFQTDSILEVVSRVIAT